MDLKDALKIIGAGDDETFELMLKANQIKQKHKGNKIKLCAIVNAKSGKCSENCSFCAQSAHHQTNMPSYPLLSSKEIIKAAKAAEKNMGATCFSVVTSGKATKTKAELQTIGASLEIICRETKLNRCVSIGTLTKPELLELKAKGLKRLHHNLETAKSFFDQVCTTHIYEERLNTIKAAKEIGLEVCSGGIFGLGESLEQRIELGLTLKEFKVESVPINILNPIPGTPAAKNYQPMKPLEVLRLIATYRLLMPKADLGVFGGREKALGPLQPLMFLAGANVTLVGDYLTTKGQQASQDLEMIKALGLEIDYA